MTVSRVINAEPGVTELTRAKVRAAVSQIGYVPNSAARSLAGGQQCRIALLHSNPSAAYLSELLVGSLAEASAGNIELVVEMCLERETAEELAKRLVRHRIDGVILPAPLCEDIGLLEVMHAAGLAIAQIAAGSPAPFAFSVTIDDEAAAYAMTTRLIALGHRGIGFIGGNVDQASSTLRRIGHDRALAEAGIASSPDLFVPGDFTYRSGMIAAEQLLAATPRPTAIFASNDDMAAAAIAAAHRAGLDVPGDVSICGFDDTAMATAIWPELTTIRQPVADMARHAIRLLARAVRSKTGAVAASPEHVRLDFALIARMSDGRLAKDT